MTTYRLHRAPRSLMSSGRKLRALVVILAVITTVLTLGGVAFAYLTATGTGTGTVTTGTLNPPTAVSGSQVGVTSTVAVSWTAPVTGAAPTGYYVLRTPSPSGPTVAACGTSAASPTVSTSCNDASVPNGSYRYVVVAVHHTWTASSAQSAVVTVTVGDVTGPTITITDPTTGTNGANWGDGACGSGSNDRRICANVSDPSGVGAVSVTLRRASDGKYYDGAGTNETDWIVASTSLPMTLNGAPQYRSAELLDRTYFANNTFTITVSATDGLGNPNTAVSVYIIDTINPTASISPAAPGHTNTGIVTIAGSDANAVTISYRIDSNAGAFLTFAGSPFVTTLGAGTHTVDYFVTDASGRVSPTVNDAPIIVDLTAPGAPAITDIHNDTGSSSTDNITRAPVQQLSGTGEVGATVTVTRTVGASTPTTCTATVSGGGTWFCGTTITLSAGVNTWTATQTDLAGNVSPASISFSATLDVTSPTAPVIEPGAETGAWALGISCSSAGLGNRICVQAADAFGVASATVQIIKGTNGGSFSDDFCWNGSAGGTGNFPNIGANGNVSSCIFFAMTYNASPDRWAPTNSLTVAGAGSTNFAIGTYTLRIVVTDVAGNAVAVVRTFGVTGA